MLASHNPAAEEVLDGVLLLLILLGSERPELSPSLPFQMNILKTKVVSASSPTIPDRHMFAHGAQITK